MQVSLIILKLEKNLVHVITNNLLLKLLSILHVMLVKMTLVKKCMQILIIFTMLDRQTWDHMVNENDMKVAGKASVKPSKQ